MKPDTLHIPRYIIQSEIGYGSMAMVYLALDRLTRQTVALKVLKSSTMSDDRRLSLAHEFQTMASLRHPYIVSVLDYGFTSEGSPYFAMDYLPHAQTFVQAGHNQPTDTQVQLILQLLEALAYLHRRGILHHDLKPSNVVVHDLSVQVVDFGLATSTEESDLDSLGGSLAYVAPERLRKQSIRPASELFAVGLMTYEMLSGAYPFPPTPAIAMINGILNTDLDFKQFGLPDPVVAVLQQLVMKNPDQRYQSAQTAISDLRHALGTEQADDAIRIRESYLQAASYVGRQDELDQLQTALKETQQGHSQIWLLGGESGVGKTRLVEELRIQALIQNFEVLHGQAIEGGGFPFQIWREPVRRLLLTRTIDDLHASILKEIVPDIELLLDRPVATVSPLQGTNHLHRLVYSVIDLLRHPQVPVLLIFEDLQWTTESLEVIRGAFEVLDQLPNVMILGTYRNDEHDDPLQDLSGVHRIILDRLQDDELSLLSQAILGDQGADPQLVSHLIRETEGNTFFIVEVMRAWAEDAGHIEDIMADAVFSSVFTQGMDQLLRPRIHQLASMDQELLRLAAVVGRQLNQTVMAKLVDETTIGPWLQRCSDAAILNVVEGTWQFTHDKLRDTVLLQLSDEAKKSLHRRVATAVESTYPEDSDYYPILLEHWHQAGDIEKEIDYLEPVAENLIQFAGEYGQAQQIIERGLSVIAHDDIRRVALLNWQTQALRRQGHFAAAQVYATQAKESAYQLEDQFGFATSIHNLGLTSQLQGELDQAIEYYQQSLNIRRSIQDTIGIGNTLNNLGMIYDIRNETRKANECYEQALNIAKINNDQFLQFNALVNLSNLRTSQKQGKQAVIYSRQALNVAQKIGNPTLLQAALNDLGILNRNRKSYEEALQNYSQSLEMARKLNSKLVIAEVLNNLGLLALDLNQYERAERYFTESLNISKDHGSSWDVPSTSNNLGFLYLKTEDKRAWDTFHVALSLAWSDELIPLVLESLIGYAFLYLHQRNPVESAELVGLVQHHPSHFDDIQIWIDKLMPELEQALDPTDLQAALDRGKGFDLAIEVKELLSNHA